MESKESDLREGKKQHIEGREEAYIQHYLCVLYLLEAHLFHDEISYTIITLSIFSS